MKRFFNVILGIIFIILEPTLYLVDRVICAILFWIEVQSFNEWRSKSTVISDIKNEIPDLDIDSYKQISEFRNKTRFNNHLNALIRIGVFSLISILLKFMF